MPSWLSPSADDPRGLLEKFRRKELYAVMDNEGLEYPQDAPATICREILRNNGIRAEKYIDQQGNFLWPEVKTSQISIDDLKMPQLRKKCAEHRVQWSMKDTKDELKAKLKQKMGIE